MKNKIILITIAVLLLLPVINAADFNIPSGYRQLSATNTMTELENDAGEYIVVTDGNYITYEDLIYRLGNDYMITGIKDIDIDGNKVKEYKLSSKSTIKYVYTFRHWGHTYNIAASPFDVIFWNVESRSNPVNQIITTFQ